MSFDHNYTPVALSEINSELALLLAENEVDSQRLAELIDKRDECVQAHLRSLDEDAKKQFAQHELPTQEQIRLAIQPIFEEAKKALSSVVQAKKIINQYK